MIPPKRKLSWEKFKERHKEDFQKRISDVEQLLLEMPDEELTPEKLEEFADYILNPLFSEKYKPFDEYTILSKTQEKRKQFKEIPKGIIFTPFSEKISTRIYYYGSDLNAFKRKKGKGIDFED